ncbi:trypsin-like cysteine/serine peptidase domain-containing protein [Gigaspora rosea]|uniref:Trypsin-like cysteine/serine peptidase domain-containing protein n=1 Tax=Gigaspora rosea TaxID=44941 RepID=A0A397V9Q7_9GLOM|nr:trypsin-like cysteine/serine peptidase domain-containing protein [Gigaspora rosea]
MGGDGLYKIGTRNGTCTAGFVAITQENITCIATARHCYLNDAKYYLLPWNSDPTTTYLIGQMNFANLDKIDFGLIPIVGDVRPEPSIRNTDSEKNRELFIDDDIAVSHYGVHLCVSGYYSHVKCGYVRSLSGFASRDKNFYENLFIVGLDVIEGDSGSPLFSYKQNLTRVSLNGILHGGARGNETQGKVAIVITISSILNTLRKVGREISVVTAK